MKSTNLVKATTTYNEYALLKTQLETLNQYKKTERAIVDVTVKLFNDNSNVLNNTLAPAIEMQEKLNNNFYEVIEGHIISRIDTLKKELTNLGVEV